MAGGRVFELLHIQPVFAHRRTFYNLLFLLSTSTTTSASQLGAYSPERYLLLCLPALLFPPFGRIANVGAAKMAAAPRRSG